MGSLAGLSPLPGLSIDPVGVVLLGVMAVVSVGMLFLRVSGRRATHELFQSLAHADRLRVENDEEGEGNDGLFGDFSGERCISNGSGSLGASGSQRTISSKYAKIGPFSDSNKSDPDGALSCSNSHSHTSSLGAVSFGSRVSDGSSITGGLGNNTRRMLGGLGAITPVHMSAALLPSKNVGVSTSDNIDEYKPCS